MSEIAKPDKMRPQLHPCDFGPHWNSIYYEIMQEYYWDPKLIGRVPSNPPIFANDREMLGNLRRMEVSLNHMLALFFGLAPQDYIRGLEIEVFGSTSGLAYRNIGIFKLRRTAPHDPTQPDVFLVSDDTCLSVEVKIGAKSSLEQVVKYALLHRDHEKKSGRILNNRLIYLTPRPVSKTWAENYPSVAEMNTALESFDYPAFLQKSKMTDVVSAADLKASAGTMQVGHITFNQLNTFTKNYVGSIPPGAIFADTVGKLLDGLLHELEFRRDLLNL